MADGWDEELLTLDLYGQEDGQGSTKTSSRPTYKELQLEVNYLKQHIDELKERIAVLEWEREAATY